MTNYWMNANKLSGCHPFEIPIVAYLHYRASYSYSCIFAPVAAKNLNLGLRAVLPVLSILFHTSTST